MVPEKQELISDNCNIPDGGQVTLQEDPFT